MIFDEFGIDKIGDVLDSAQAGELFEDVFASAIMNPETIEASADHTVARIREDNPSSGVLSPLRPSPDEPDVQAAERLVLALVAPLGGADDGGVSQLSWRPGIAQTVIVGTHLARWFTGNAHSTHGMLIVTAIRFGSTWRTTGGLALNLPQIGAGQPLPA